MMERISTIAVSAARDAGVLLVDAFHQGKHRTHVKADKSFVTDTDYASDQLIQSHIRGVFPDHVILSEEMDGALEKRIGDEPTWVIDPLDGTSNFIAGIPIFGITIAFVEGGEAKLGLIFDPIHNELFVAQAGEGATLNGEAIHVSSRDEARGAMLFAGRGYKDRDQERHGKIIYALERETTYFRRLGCASVMLSSVAAGRADSVIMTGSKPWDILAGALLVREAGGQATDYCGDPWVPNSPDLVATNGYLHEQIVSITNTDELCL